MPCGFDWVKSEQGTSRSIEIQKLQFGNIWGPILVFDVTIPTKIPSCVKIGDPECPRWMGQDVSMQRMMEGCGDIPRACIA